MNTVSRTKRTIQNSTTSFVLFLIQIFVGFYSRKIFLEALGDELIGLNTTLGNILGFINLAELGIGIAMATSLYKPIYDKDEETICEILSIQGYLYRKIAIGLCAISIPIIAFLPILFPQTTCGNGYVIIAYIVFLWGSISSYLWNYRQILIGADQKNYKLMPWRHSIRYAKVFLQIFFLTVIPLGIWGWISLEFVGSTLSIFAINHVLNKEYPWLHKSKRSSSFLLEKYHHLIIKTKQLFVHKIGSFVLEQTAPLIIYMYVSLTMVTYYGNYMILIGYTVTLMNVLFEGMGASIGSLVAENNKRHTLDVFWELFSSRIWISGIACFSLYVAITPFIISWIGGKYVLSNATLLLLILGMFIRMSRSIVDSFKNAYQLFADIWSPIVEAAINLGCSLLFGYWWGLNGIIMGSNLSLILIVLIWKPYYTFKYGFKTSCIKYFYQYAIHIIILILGGFASVLGIQSLWQSTASTWQTVLCIITKIFLYALITFIPLFILTPGMRHFTSRIKNLKSKI